MHGSLPSHLKFPHLHCQPVTPDVPDSLGSDGKVGCKLTNAIQVDLLSVGLVPVPFVLSQEAVVASTKFGSETSPSR